MTAKAKDRKQKAKAGRGDAGERRTVSPSPFSGARPPAPDSAEGRAAAARPAGVAVVGAGRLGTALALALGRRGYEVRALVSRSPARARRAAAAAEVDALALGLGQLDRLPEVGLLFITTPDDLIAETAGLLAGLPGLRGRLALHASGALSSEVLAPLRGRGFSVGSMHPLAAVSDARAGAARLSTAAYCVEGDAAAVRGARRVVEDLGGRSFAIDPGRKALYHASALLTAGHTVALFDLAVGALSLCGLSRRRAQTVLLELLRGAVDNLGSQPPERALTGSFARADAETVRRHIEALGPPGDPHALSAYLVLGEHSLRLAERAGADPEAVGKVRHALAEASAGAEAEGGAAREEPPGAGGRA